MRKEQTSHKNEHNTLMCFPLEPVFTRDKRRLPNFIDEPMNGLDKHGVKEIREVLLRMKEENRVILLSSHNPKDIDYLCDVVFEMDDGYLQEMNDAKEDK